MPGYGPSRKSARKSSRGRHSPIRPIYHNKKKRGKQRNEYVIGWNEQTPREWADNLELPTAALNCQSTRIFPKRFYTPCRQVLAQSYRQVESWKRINQVTVVPGYHEYITTPKPLSETEDESKTIEEEKQDESKANNIGEDFGGDRWKKANKRPKEVLPRPIQRFNHIDWPSDIKRQINLAGFTKPTPIQCVTWPLVLSGYNVIGIAQTGSGKTLAFLLPAIVHMRAQKGNKQCPAVLICSPTRELAKQTEGEIMKFADNVKYCCCYGGKDKDEQIEVLQKGVEIVCGTPGRLLDLVSSEERPLKLNRVCSFFMIYDDVCNCGEHEGR